MPNKRKNNVKDSFIITEIIDTVKLLDKYCKIVAKKLPVQNQLINGKEGLLMSQTVCRQQNIINMTPFMKQLIMKVEGKALNGDDKVKIKVTDYKDINSMPTVKVLTDLMDAAINLWDHQFSTGKFQSGDWKLFLQDNRHALKAWETKFWDIQNGQAEQRKRALSQFSAPTKLHLSWLLDKLTNDQHFRRAAQQLYDLVPAVVASKDYLDARLDFQNKHSNTSYPFFRRDNLKKEGTNQTWGKYLVDYTKSLTNNGKSPERIIPYNVFTAWPRNQMGKGRAIEASSRIVNIELFRVNGPETQLVKRIPEFMALLPYSDLKSLLVEFRENCDKLELTTLNIDQSQYDLHQSYAMILLVNAIRYIKAKNSDTKKLIKLRAALQAQFILIDGPNNRITTAYGRTPSGYIDTMLFNTYASIFLNDYTKNLVDHQSLQLNNKITLNSAKGAFLGDDILTFIPTKSDHWEDNSSNSDSITLSSKQYLERLSKTYRDLGYEVNADKTVFGTFFLQNRLFRDPETGEWKMSYSIPRVVRSMMSKENAKGLGPVGWTMAAWQQLEKLRDWKPGLTLVTSLFVELDRDDLLLDKPIDWIKDQLRKEDKSALELKPKGFETAAEKLYDGNPQNANMFTNKSDFNFDYLAKLQSELREAYDPNILSRLGFKFGDNAKSLKNSE